ncbi:MULTISPECIES: cytochrome b [unclassified Francisella]|uniref:cytochrome b n=1 Tax=unclassified Francisella TaxID=2610885 RepID=UPI002E2F8B61|nr:MULTISPECIES: cytochrome b/b6 domain-containing protein [unclassified Francisella]MED7819940.1 cytochrome b/b6 domain-containing protein [Francisella sp. 19S2-4]MED7830760.1 cytochrome b/b6 domain-containing protein [Francisella sp. 19S2-10]
MKYNFWIRQAHKVLGIFIIIQFFFGMTAYYISLPAWLVDLHRSFGYVAFALVIFLIVTRLIKPNIPYNPPLSILNYIIAKIVHFGLYISVLGMSLTGIIASIFSAHERKIFYLIPLPQIPNHVDLSSYIFSFHSFFAYMLAICFILHILAVIYHQIILKDNILARMW